ncbi:hypothetical protein FKM82_025384 [Ascaphus truei]
MYKHPPWAKHHLHPSLQPTININHNKNTILTNTPILPVWLPMPSMGAKITQWQGMGSPYIPNYHCSTVMGKITIIQIWIIVHLPIQNKTKYSSIK